MNKFLLSLIVVTALAACDDNKNNHNENISGG